MTLAKKGIGITLEVLFGTVFFLLFLFFMFSIARDLLIVQEDWQSSFEGFVEVIELVSDGEKLNSESYLLKLEKDSAIIGFNPVDHSSLSYIGDGDFHYVVNTKIWEEIKDKISSANDPIGEITHMQRPNACNDDDACVCLCRQPDFRPTSDDYALSKGVDPDEDNYYVRTGRASFFNVPIPFSPGEVPLSYMIECSALECRNIEGANFNQPMKNDYYNQYYSYYDGDFFDDIGGRVNQIKSFHDDLTCAATVFCSFPASVYNYYFNPDEGGLESDFVYDNGFALYRGEDDGYKGIVMFGYTRPLSASIPVFVTKQSTGAISVCIDGGCIDDIESETTHFNLYDLWFNNSQIVSGECRRGIAHSIGSDDEYYKIYNFLTADYPLEEEYSVLPYFSSRNGLESDLSLRIISEGNRITYLLGYYCITGSDILINEVIEYDKAYSDVCGEDIDIQVSGGDVLSFTAHADWELNDPICVSG